MLSKELDESADEDLIIEDDIEDKGLKDKNQNIPHRIFPTAF